MITADILLKALDAELDAIHSNLGPDWPAFRRELAPVLATYADVTDRRVLPGAVGLVLQVCGRYPAAARTIEACAESHFRRVEEPGSPDILPILEIANRFQSLLARLEAVGPAENGGAQRSDGQVAGTGMRT